MVYPPSKTCARSRGKTAKNGALPRPRRVFPLTSDKHLSTAVDKQSTGWLRSSKNRLIQMVWKTCVHRKIVLASDLWPDLGCPRVPLP